MESLENEIGSQQKFRSEERVMEIQEEKVRCLQKIHSQRKGLMEEKKEEKVPHYKSRIRAHPERPVAEKSSRVEAEEEKASLLSKVPLLHLRLGP